MTSPTIFPLLAGQGWSVHKKPTFATTVASHVSAREVRSPHYVNPIWQFELTFDGLDATAAGQYGGLGAASLQALMGLFLECQGQYGSFVYYDPTDYTVTAQAFGSGDGTTTSFPLQRTLGGFAEPVVAPLQNTGFAQLAIPGQPYPNMNLLTNSVGSNLGMFLSNVTVTGGQTDPNGGATAVLVAETTANGQHVIYHGAEPTLAGGAETFSAYLMAGGSRYVQLYLANNAYSATVYANFDLTGGVVTAKGATGGATGPVVTMTAIGGGWWRCSVSSVVDPSSTQTRVYVGGVATSTSAPGLTYAGSTSNTFYVAFPNLELDLAIGAPGPFVPTLTTVNYGAPSITVGGVYVDPASYTLSNGVVTFTTAPASGAALAWSGNFGFLCRFDGDDLDFEQFMANLWRAQSVKFRSLRAQ